MDGGKRNLGNQEGSIISTTSVAQMKNHPPSQVRTHLAHASTRCYSTALATAAVDVKNVKGSGVRVRALLDQGSEATFISEALVQLLELLELPRRQMTTPLIGIGNCRAGTAHGVVTLELGSCVNRNFKLETEALILYQLTAKLTSRTLLEPELGNFKNLELADPRFYTSDSVDLVLGVDVYGRLLGRGIRQIAGTMPTAQNTVLGWVIAGHSESSLARRAEPCPSESLQVLHGTTDQDLYDLLSRFLGAGRITYPCS